MSRITVENTIDCHCDSARIGEQEKQFYGSAAPVMCFDTSGLPQAKGWQASLGGVYPVE
ncbi:MAG: hypothetical protein PHY40_03030 [Patescibacteria group bacterium]|nr:hypothetical protein [Patescibacteria group bacterium]